MELCSARIGYRVEFKTAIYHQSDQILFAGCINLCFGFARSVYHRLENWQKLVLAFDFCCLRDCDAWLYARFFLFQNEVLFRNQHGELNGEEITAIANAWITGNWIRVVIMAIGFLAALSALRATAVRVKNDAPISSRVARS